jgi:type I restriction enzyme S subunit
MMNVPEIRFKGFTDAWEQSNLSALYNFSNGINAPKEQYGKGRKMISVMDILSDEPISYNFIKSAVDVDEKTEKNNKVEQGDLVLVRSSEVVSEVGWSKAYTENEYALFSGFTIRGKRKEQVDSFFIELSLNHKNRVQVESKAGGSTRFNVSQSILNEVTLLKPEIAEQSTISLFFSTLESIIIQHKQKYENIKKLKDAFLQAMFPNLGESLPLMRFLSCNGEWKKIRLSDFLTERNEQSFPSSEYPLVSFTVENGVTPKTQRYNREFLVRDEQKKYKVTRYDDIVYNPANLKFGAIARNTYGKAVFSPIYVTFDVGDAILPFFAEILVTNPDFIKRALMYQEGTVYERMAVKPEDFLNFEVFVPKMEEQIIICQFFSVIDDELKAISKKIENLKKMKIAFLQKMLI